MALYRKYRPARFADVVGQEHVTEPLRVALAAGRINHAYLFSGPRGCGKTSSARILARSLNCAQGPTPDPCGVCHSCVALAPEGSGNIDVIELDAASHGGVDDARELRDRAFYAPAESQYRVFIVDEAHMVTTQGFNALLKIVEEPPDHLVFVFATTEPDKVLATIRSRTHHYPFRLIPPGTLRALLERICADEGAVVAPPVFPLVIRAGGGSARDSLSVLDQLLAGAGPEGVTYERAVALLGVTDLALIDDTVDALAALDGGAVFQAVDRLVEAGHDPRRFAADLLERLRDLMLIQAVPEAAARGLVNAPGDEMSRMADQAARLGAATLSRYGEILHTGLTEMRGATAPRLLLELLCGRMLLPAASADDAALLQRLERMERRLEIAAIAPAGERVALADPVRSAERSDPVRSAERSDPVRSAERSEPAASTEPVSGALDAAAVRRVWPEVLAAAKDVSRSTGAMLMNAGVKALDDGAVVLTINSAPLARRLSEPRNTEVIAAALRSVLGVDWRVRCEHQDGSHLGSHPDGGSAHNDGQAGGSSQTDAPPQRSVAPRSPTPPGPAAPGPAAPGPA
ncbi:MAG: DNA polymerase III subunit gamma and tau, partial [Actinomycetota bacterium]|nr:DNA polymerase III subunit gamma and tau [Actinomycetota bacterium]